MAKIARTFRELEFIDEILPVLLDHLHVLYGHVVFQCENTAMLFCTRHHVASHFVPKFTEDKVSGFPDETLEQYPVDPGFFHPLEMAHHGLLIVGGEKFRG